LPAWTIRLWKIYSLKCNGGIFKTDIRRNQNRKSDCSETFHEICHHFSKLWIASMENGTKECRTGTRDKKLQQRKESQHCLSLFKNGWPRTCGKKTSGTAFRWYAATCRNCPCPCRRTGYFIYGRTIWCTGCHHSNETSDRYSGNCTGHKKDRSLCHT